MTAASHLCADGLEQPGDEYDCGPCRDRLAAAAQPLGHEVVHGVEPFTGQPGGRWFSRCSCGWAREGRYAREGLGRTTAERLARVWTERHILNPLEKEEDQ